MLRFASALVLISALAACGTSTRELAAPADDGELPADARLRSALTGTFHGIWTGAASGTVLRSRDGALIEVPIVLAADLGDFASWDMDATDFGEVLLERAGHYNSSVWFVSSTIEVSGRRIYITKFEDSYEDTLCLELVGLEGEGSMRFQAHSHLADPGEGERDACLGGTVHYDAALLLHPGPGRSPEFVESGRSPGDFGASPRGTDDDGEPDDEGEDGGEPDEGRQL